jgi:hypothetical protein
MRGGVNQCHKRYFEGVRLFDKTASLGGGQGAHGMVGPGHRGNVVNPEDGAALKRFPAAMNVHIFDKSGYFNGRVIRCLIGNGGGQCTIPEDKEAIFDKAHLPPLSNGVCDIVDVFVGQPKVHRKRDNGLPELFGIGQVLLLIHGKPVIPQVMDPRADMTGLEFFHQVVPPFNADTEQMVAAGSDGFVR